MSRKGMLDISLGDFLRPMIDFFTKILGVDGEVWWVEFKKFLRKESCWGITNVAEAIQNLLEHVGTIVIPATTSKFLAKDMFVVNTKQNAPVKISYLGDNFTSWFLGDVGKVEEPHGEQTLRYAKLSKSSVDGPIIEALGGEAKAETTLSEMFSLMAKQPKGEEGALFTNSWANIFYIRDRAGVLRAVSVRWGDGGWGVNASEVSHPHEWCDDYQVFSRNSGLEHSEPSASA